MSNRALAELARPFLATVLLFEEAPPTERPSADQLRDELNRLLEDFRRAALDQKLHQDEVDEARFALCAWADEIVMADHDRQSEWFERQLQFATFGVRDGGNQFYTRLEQLRPDFHRARWVYALCLTFGFRGRYGRDGEERKSRLAKALTDLQNQDQVPAGKLSPTAYEIDGEFARPRVTGLRHIVFRCAAVLGVAFLGMTALVSVFAYAVPGAP